jgi:two-component system cell cycle sensor histidine kinase/response regulator CckA
MIPAIIIPTALIICSTFFITTQKTSALQYEMLDNNVNYILAKSEADNQTISALDMADVALYQDATKQGVLLDIAKNLTPNASVAIIDTGQQTIIYSSPQDQTLTIDNTQMLTMTRTNSGRAEYLLTSTAGETTHVVAAYQGYPDWNWVIVSFVDKHHLFTYVQDALILSIIIAVSFLIITSLAVYQLSRTIAKDISALDDGARQMTTDNLDVTIVVRGHSELASLADSFNTMAARTKKTQGLLHDALNEAKLAETEIQASKKQYYDLIEGTPDLVSRVDLQGRILFVNHAAKAVFGLSAAECVGRSTIGFVHPESLQATLEGYAQWIKDPASTLTFENRLRDVDGEARYMAWSMHVEYGEDGNICNLASFARNITEQKHNELERAKLEDELRQSHKMKAVGQLAGGVAHDFNNMLGVIIGHAELALSRPDVDNPFTADFESILKAANHSADLSRQLLTFARKQAIEPQVMNLNDSVNSMFMMLKRLIGENVNLTFDAGADLWMSRVDHAQIDQVLANLCVNSRDAIDDIGSISITTTNISMQQHHNLTESAPFPAGDYVRLSVVDDGKGIETNVMAHIFEPFYTTKDINMGTGLGLATVFGAVKQNKGFIEVISESDKGGTAFHIFFPREIATVSTPTEKASKATPSGQETILIVEDDKMLLDLEATMLKKIGYKVIAAQTVNLAQQIATKNPGDIHLLLTDVIMPEMNGWDLSVEIRALRPEIKVLFMSGYTADIIAPQGVMSEEVHFLQKPFSSQSLNIKVREALSD